jgi:hypothetical protein
MSIRTKKNYSATALAALTLLTVVAVGRAQSTIPYDDLKRETQAIVTDLGLGTNALGNSKQDVYEGDCPRADQELVFADANLELARVKIPDLRDSLTRVEPNFFGRIQGRINKLRNDLKTADTTASASERDLDIFAQHFVTACPDHPLWTKFLKIKNANQGTGGNYIKILDQITHNGTAGVTEQNLNNVQANGAGLTPDGNNPNNPVVTAFISNPSDPAAKAALLNALQSGPDPMSPEDAAKASEAIANGDLPTLLALLKKYPHNATLRDAVAALMAKDHTPTQIDQAIRDATSGGPRPQPSPGGPAPNPGTKITDQNGHVMTVLDAHTTVLTTEGPTGILTSETKESGDFVGGQFKVSGQKTIDWQFNIVPTDGGFELQDHSTPVDDPDKGFNVQSWSVTDPSGSSQNFPAGIQLKYMMKAAGSYKIQANVQTKLNTQFTISLSLENTQ